MSVTLRGKPAGATMSLEQWLREDLKRVENDPYEDEEYVKGYWTAQIEIAAQFTDIDREYLMSILRKHDLEGATSLREDEPSGQ